MRIAVIGAGAIGGLVGARLAQAGCDVTFLVRGAHVAAIRRDGFTLIAADGRETVARNVAAIDDYAAAGPQDVVILAMKAHQVEAVASRVPQLVGRDTTIVTMQNGIPFWYFHRYAGALAGHALRAVDPTGACSRHLDADRIVGCVVYPASELLSPGVVRHIEGDRLPVGELDGRTTARVAAISEAFSRAGFKAPVLPDIRAEMWLKLWGNLTFNPISALTRATLADMCRYLPTRNLAAAMMREAQEVAGKLGVTFRVDLERRIAGAEKVGAHKTSMLQDVEAGRWPEVDALVGAVAELGRMTGTPTPHIDAVYALARLLAVGVAADPQATSTAAAAGTEVALASHGPSTLAPAG